LIASVMLLVVGSECGAVGGW